MLAVILIVGIFFFHRTYAAWDGTLLNDTKDFLDKALAFLSWIWIFLAIIAGKFMTNDVVYGAFMHLDKYLRDIWNVMKNFANFGLAFMILYSIIKYVINKEGEGPKQIIVNALIAGVLIQTSWFITWALVDLSTVATSAVASFPANFIWNNAIITNVQTEFQTLVTKTPQFFLKNEDGQMKRVAPAATKSDGKQCGPDDLDAMMPKYDSVGWPLIFIGMSFLRAQNFMDNWTANDTPADVGKVIVNIALKVLILLAYVGCLIGLIIANIVRVLFLRVLIMASPIIVLLGVFGKGKETWGEWMMKYFNVSTFLDLIFKPLFFIGFLWITLIFVSSMQQIMGGGKWIQDLNGVTISTVSGTGASSTIDMAGIADFTVNGDIFKGVADSTRGIFVDLMLIVMTLLLLWQMLKWSIEFWWWPVKDVMDKLTPFVESLAGNLPIAPIGKWMWVQNILDASRLGTEKVLRWAGMNKEGKFKQNEDDFRNMINAKFLGMKPAWGERDTHALEDAIHKNDPMFWNKFIETGKRTSGWVNLSDPVQMKLIEEWYGNVRTKEPGKGEIESLFWEKPWNYDIKFEDYFKHGNIKTRIDALHLKLWWTDALLEKRKPSTYEAIKNNRYYYNPDK